MNKRSSSKGRVSRVGMRTKAIDAEFLVEMLAPVYYRHEFARRNEDVVKSSEAVMQAFRLTAALVKGGTGYVRMQDGKRATLVGDLTKEFDRAPAAMKERMRAALGEHARKWGVLPVPPPPQAFFPASMGAGEEFDRKAKRGRSQAGHDSGVHTELLVIWRSLVRYEMFLLSEGMSDAPCFMPVVPLPRLGSTTGGPASPTERLDRIAKGRLLVAIDLSQNRGVLDNHLQTLMDARVAFGEMGAEEPSPREEPKTHWNTYETCLRVYDHAYDHGKGRLKKVNTYHPLAADFHSIMKGGKPLDLQSKGQERRRLYHAAEEYKSWLGQATMHIQNYGKIGTPSASN